MQRRMRDAMRLATTIAGACTMALLVGCGDGEDEKALPEPGPESTQGRAENQSHAVSASGMELVWRILDGGLLEVSLTAPTTGWAAVGFDPTTGMADANILIGYVRPDGTAVVLDEYGTSPYTHASDESLGGRTDVINISGSESGGAMQLRFQIPLDSQDPFDKTLIQGEAYTVILAYGPPDDDNTVAYHAARTAIDIVL